MDRRDVLKLGALASVSGSSCAALLGNPGAVSSAELPSFLSALDSGMQQVASGEFFARLMGPTEDPELAERARAGEELTKKTMRSLLLVGTLSELPPEQLAHESVQERLRSSMGEFDEAMFGMAKLLENLSPTERADIGKALRDDPQLGMRLMGEVDQEAASFGVSLKQRTRMRAISSQVTSRLRNSTDLTVLDCVEKMRKIEARHGGQSEFQRTLAANLTQQMIWQADTDTGGTGGLTPPPPPPQGDAQEPVNPTGSSAVDPSTGAPIAKKKRESHPSYALLTAGGIALGLGLAVFGIGFATNQSAGILLGVTFGVILGVAGLVCLLIGLILLAAGK